MDLTATAGDKQVTLTWNDSDQSITEYLIYRSYSPGGEGPGPIARVGGGSGTGITFTDTGLTNHQIYYYTVTAVFGGSESAFSNEASATPFNIPPTITVPASPIVVTGVRVPLPVTVFSGDQPPSPITIIWRVTGPSPVTFTNNGITGSGTTTATFTAAGTYTFTVYATDTDGATTTSTVTVVVQQTLTAISVQTPSPPPLSGGSYFFQTGGTDQFGNPMSPGGATYQVTSGTGSVSGSTNPPGFRFTAPPGITAPETDTITMTDGTFTKTITVSVTPPASNMGAWGPGSSPVSYTGTISGTDATGHDFSRNIAALMDLGQVSLGSGQSGSVTASGTISWTFAWQSAQNSPPPSVSYFAVSGGVTGSNYDSGMGGSGSPTADDGFGDPQQDTYGTSGQVTSASSGGTRLFKEGGSSSVTVATKTFTSTSSGGVGMDESGLLEAGYGFSAGPVPAPSVAVVSPGSGSVIQVGGDVTATVKVDLSVNGNASNALLSLSLKVQGGAGGGGGDLTPDGNGYASLDLGTLAAGTYTLTAVAMYDNGDAPLEVDSQPVTFTVASFTVTGGSWTPNPNCVGEISSGQAQAKFDPTSVDGGGGGPTFVVYTWTTAGVYYSQDGTSGAFEPYGGNSIIEWQQGQANTTFQAQCSDVGFYILEAQCVATVYSQYTGLPVATFTQTCYIGGSASDIDQSGGTSHARKVFKLKAHVAVAHDGGGGTGHQEAPATVTFSPNSLVKLGLGAPTGNKTTITATVTPADKAGTIAFSSTNGDFTTSNGEVTISPSTPDASGKVTLTITAASATPGLPGNSGSPDCYVIATAGLAGAQPLATVPVLILIPATVSENPASMNLKTTNAFWTYNNQPTAEWPIGSVPKGSEFFATQCKGKVDIQIYDQFGNKLDTMYDMKPVHEVVTGNIPQTIDNNIQFPSGVMRGGLVEDDVAVAIPVSVSANQSSIDKIENGWIAFDPIFPDSSGDLVYDNAYAILGGTVETLKQQISVGGINVTPIWDRVIITRQLNYQDHFGSPVKSGVIGTCTETAEKKGS